MIPPPFIDSYGKLNVDHEAVCRDLWGAGAQNAGLGSDNPHPWRVLSCAPLREAEAHAEAALTPYHARQRFLFDPMVGKLYANTLDASHFEAQARNYKGTSLVRRQPEHWANHYNARIAGNPIVGEMVAGHRVMRVTVDASPRQAIRMDRLAFCLTYGQWPAPDACVTALYPPQMYEPASGRPIPIQFPYGVLRMTDTIKPDLLLYTTREYAEREGKRVLL